MKKILICLECNGRILREIRSDELKEPVVIGRDAGCGWSLAGVDPSASARHAELYRRRGAVWIRDLGSRNGITCAGERVTRRRVRAGDRFHVGACMLSAEAVAERDARDVLPYHRIEQLNGPDAGRVLELVGPADVVVGSDPACAVPCVDPLVSREHAALAIKPDGSVWVRDLGSRNGTSVNGTPLAKGKERMLRDGDVLSAAYVEFRFTDKDVEHPRAHLLRKTGVAAATVAVALIGWYSYASVRPSSKALLKRSLDFAAACRFDEAEAAVRDSAEARGAGAYARRRAEIAQNLEAWRETHAAWGVVRDSFAKRDWDGVQAESVRLRDWNWNASDAPREGVRAERSLALVRSFRSAQRALEEGKGAAELAAESAALSAATNRLLAADSWPSGGLPWAEPLLSAVGLVLPELDETAFELRRVDEIADGLRPGPAGAFPSAARDALAELDALLAANLSRRETLAASPDAAFRPSRAVEIRVAEFRAPLRDLAVSEAVFATNVFRIAAARFGDASPELPLPSEQLVGLHPAFAGYRTSLRERNASLCGEVLAGWRTRFQTLAKAGVDASAGKGPAPLAVLFSPAVASRVLEFVPSATVPVSRLDADAPLAGCAYDAFVGIHDFVAFLDELDPDLEPDRAVSAYGRMVPEWETVLESARAACEKLRTYCAYRNASGPSGPLVRLVLAADVPGGNNEIARTLRFAESLLRAKDEWAEQTFPALCAKEGSPRAAILARGVRLLLSDAPDAGESAALARDWRAFRKSLPKWDGTETVARDIFHAALPGLGEHGKAWKFLRRDDGPDKEETP